MSAPDNDAGGNDKAGPEYLLALYETLLARATRMLGWAQRGEWEPLIEEETRYVGDVSCISDMEASVELTVDQMLRKAEILEAILERSLALKQYLNQQRDDLGERIHESEQKREQIDRYLKWDDAG